MELDLANWSERHTYFLGRFYDLATQLALKIALRPGDRFVDIGANIGMISLLGAYLVGPDGRVEAVEPNPECKSRLEQTIAKNQISQITIIPFAFSSCARTATLKILTEHSGTGTIADISADHVRHVTREFAVQQIVADDQLLRHVHPIRMIKMDVEGYELEVLKGMRLTIRRDRPVMLTEVDGLMLRRAGSDETAFRSFLESLGYEGFLITTRRQILRHRLTLLPVQSASVSHYNAIWLPKDRPDIRAQFDSYTDFTKCAVRGLNKTAL